MKFILLGKEEQELKSFLKCEDGQAVVEFAIIAPILLLILCGIIDFGWIFSAQIATNNCAREGARFASTSASYSTVINDTTRKVNSSASDIIRQNLLTEVSYSTPYKPDSGDVTVKVTSEVKTLTIVADTIFGGSFIKLYSNVTMKVG
jgi:Flp pilus assembly protein TadG